MAEIPQKARFATIVERLFRGVRRFFRLSALDEPSKTHLEPFDSPSSCANPDAQAIDAAAVEAARSDVPIGVLSEEELRFFEDLGHRYQLIQRLDRGGQGVVFEAMQIHTDRRVAIKVLDGGLLPSKTQRERFDREVRIVAQLRHPNIVSVYDSGLLQGRPYIVMELIEGVPINDHFLLHRPSVDEAVALFVKVCRAVNFAHQNAVIHRDLKPANILVAAGGEPSILDFGLAKSLIDSMAGQDESVVSSCGQLVGTPPYMSPEQVSGENSHVDIRSDVYSLGVVLYELLVGSMPYPVKAVPPEQILTNIRTRDPISPNKAVVRLSEDDRFVHGTISDDLEKVLLRALAKDPARRYQSAGDFADDLDRYLRSEAVEAKADSPLYVLRKVLRRHRFGVAVAASFLMVLVGALIAVTFAWRHSQWVAEVAQAGLRAAAYIRLGSFERDEERPEKALALFESAVRIAGSVKSDDRVLARCAWDANNNLANLYLDDKRLDMADKYCTDNERLVADLERMSLDDEVYRMRSSTLYQRSRIFSLQENFAAAVAAAKECVQLRTTLIKNHPTEHALRVDLAYSHENYAKMLRMFRRRRDSLEFFTLVQREYQALHSEYPNNVDHLISCVASLNGLATWHMDLRTVDGDQQARQYLEEAKKPLAELASPGRRASRQKDANDLQFTIEANLKILDARAADRRRPAAGTTD